LDPEPYIGGKVGVKVHMVITPNLYTDTECLLPPQVCSKINVPSNKGYLRHPNRVASVSLMKVFLKKKGVWRAKLV